MPEYLKIKKTNCTNCFKCIRHCPVKSIRFSANQAHIIQEDCILCGSCFVVCPQDAKEIIDDTEKVKTMLWGESPVIASVAPSFIAYFGGVPISSLEKALVLLGFSSAEETAIGATFVKNDYEHLLKEKQRDILISSCCHTVNLLIQKYYPGALPYLANTITPMQAHSIDIKRRNPDAKTVFIGPCLSKKDEAETCSDAVDAVMTFDELNEWLKAENIELEHETDSNEESLARFFPTSGGILKTMYNKPDDYSYITVSGLDNCISALKDIEQGISSPCFIEMSACASSCINGPIMKKNHASPIRDYIQITEYAGDKDYAVEALPPDTLRKALPIIYREAAVPDEAEIAAILVQMGKLTPEQELNCSSCGYDSCHDKAVAVFQGKADISMCLPFLKDRAETFSDNIIRLTHNGVIVLNEYLEVQQINRAAMRIMNIRNANNVLGEKIVRILDPKDFETVMETGEEIRSLRVYLPEYDKYVDQSIIYDKECHIVLCLMRDVTKEEAKREKKEAFNRQTAEIADKVVEKQMRVVQEIASLLGETTAETKIALTKLKESISDE